KRDIVFRGVLQRLLKLGAREIIFPINDVERGVSLVPPPWVELPYSCRLGLSLVGTSADDPRGPGIEFQKARTGIYVVWIERFRTLELGEALSCKAEPAEYPGPHRRATIRVPERL